jgi:hypothetical protein
MLCLIIDKCRRQKLCKRAQKVSAAAPLRVMASLITLASKRAFRVLLLELLWYVYLYIMNARCDNMLKWVMLWQENCKKKT